MVTIREIAKLSGVSKTTVVRVLRDAPYVRPEIRQRVREIASLYAYQPTSSPTQTTDTTLIGVIIPRVMSSVFSRVLSGILSTANAHSCQVIVLENIHDVTKTCMALHVLREHGVKGILIASGMFDRIPVSEALTLWSHGVHLVAIDGQPFGDECIIDSIENDFEDLLRGAINYLRRLHHQRIVYLGYSTESSVNILPREKAIRRVLKTYDVPYYSVQDYKQGFEQPVVDVLLHRFHPTGIIVWNDRIAARVMTALQKRGILVPEEISCLGIGNDRLCEVTTPELSSVEQHFVNMGIQAMQLLRARIQAGESPSSYQKQRILLPTEVISRASCAPFRPR